jgi:hypothetical protein
MGEMIQLTVEIKDEQFVYKYEVGGSSQSGSMKLCADSLASFTDLLRLCTSNHRYRDKEWEREMMAKAYLEKKANEEKTNV